MDFDLPRIEFHININPQQVNDSLILMKAIVVRAVEIVLRLPGLLLLELWWRNKDISFEEMSHDIQNAAEPFNSYLHTESILAFVHRRDFDSSAALILRNSVLVLSALFLSLRLPELIRMYANALSLAVFAFSHYMSTTYIALEQTSKDNVLQLDQFTKLERHGFHFLAQLVLSILQSFILRLESDVGRAFLTMFTAPIVARMCGCPPDKLIHAHNVACCLAMLYISIYMLYRVPEMIQGMRNALIELKTIFVGNGLAMGSVTVWRRLRLAEQLTFAWLTMFFIRVYVEVYEKDRGWREAGPVLLSGIAESTNTPLSLLSLGLAVGYVCKWIVDGAQMVVGGRRDHGHVLAHSGYTEALTLVLLCAQVGFIGMKVETKAFMLGIALFIVMSALLQSLYELLEPQLLSLAASPTAPRGRHLRCLALAFVLLVTPMIMLLVVVTILPFDLWCVIICSNAVLVTVHAVSLTIQYGICLVESRAPEPWERSDDLLFATRTITKCIELVVAMLVVVFGVGFIIGGNWSLATIVILAIHIVINIYKRLEHLMNVMNSRSLAVQNLSRLPRANTDELKERSDVCAICFMDMVEEARVTPCRHFFHGACLRKWLAVKQVCPLCYSDMAAVSDPGKDSDVPPPAATERDAEWRELHRMDGARDMWPLLREREFSDEESDVDGETDDNSTTATEYTLASTDSDTPRG